MRSRTKFLQSLAPATRTPPQCRDRYGLFGVGGDGKKASGTVGCHPDGRWRPRRGGADPEAFLADAESMPGFLPLYWDSDSGDLHADIGGLDGPLIYYTGLSQGVGSNDLGLDRGRLGDTHFVQFERVGSKVLLKALNSRYVARSESIACLCLFGGSGAFA